MKVAVVGGSLGGLGAAVAFHRLGAKVKVFEKSAVSFEKRGASLGFVDVDLWESLKGKQMIRRGRQASRQQGAFYYGDLWKFLYDGLPEGTIHFNQTITDMGDDVYTPTINGEVFDLAVVADGGWSQFRSKYVDSKRPEYAGFVGYRFRLDSSYTPTFRSFGAYSNGPYFSIFLPVPMPDGRNFIMGGVLIETHPNDIVEPETSEARHTEADTKEARVPDWFLPLFEKQFGDVNGGDLARFMETAAVKGKISPSPQFEFAADRVVNGRVVIIGDAAHMASPRTASGAHTAILDAMGLLTSFSAIKPDSIRSESIVPGNEVSSQDQQCKSTKATAKPDTGHKKSWIDDALVKYATDAVPRAHQLYQRSKLLSREHVSGRVAEGTRKYV